MGMAVGQLIRRGFADRFHLDIEGQGLTGVGMIDIHIHIELAHLDDGHVSLSLVGVDPYQHARPVTLELRQQVLDRHSLDSILVAVAVCQLRRQRFVDLVAHGLARERTFQRRQDMAIAMQIHHRVLCVPLLNDVAGLVGHRVAERYNPVFLYGIDGQSPFPNNGRLSAITAQSRNVPGFPVTPAISMIFDTNIHAHQMNAMTATYRGWPTDSQRPLVIGHRGARAHAPENTLASFRKATELGADMWELDVHLTRDGVCVVSHDADLSRTAGVERTIPEMTLAEVAAIEKIAIPTFDEVVALAEQLGAGLYVELKGDGTGPLVRRTLESKAFRFAAIGSFRAGWVRELRDAGCEYPLAILVRVGGNPFAMADRSGADIIHLCWEGASARPQDLVTAELLARAKTRSLEVVLWHEERPAVIADIIELPVLGICSDKPEMLFEARGQI